MLQEGQDKSLADKKRALLIKNAYLGLEKVENCHKVKSQKMSDQMMLRTMVRQYDRERYIMSLTTYRAQQLLKSRLGNMISKSELQLARASGEREKMKQLLQEISDRQVSNLAGPTAVEEILFQQVLESRRDSLIDMRKPENYSRRSDKKGFWEEDEEFYKSFEGAIRNPFQMIDGLMEKYGRGQSTDGQDYKPFARRTKSLSAVEKMSFTNQKDLDKRHSALRRRSALPRVSNHFREIVESHEKTTIDLHKQLDQRRQSLYLGIEPLALNKNKRDADIQRALEKFENSTRKTSDEHMLPEISQEAEAGIGTKSEWKKMFAMSHVPSLTWKHAKV